MKKHYLKTGNKKVMSAVLLAATMMMGLTACGGFNEETQQSESSVVESTAPSSVEESTEESSVEESAEESTAESSEAGSENEEAKTRTFTMDVDGVEKEFVETLFSSENGFNIWYQADLFEVAEMEGIDGFVQVGMDEAVGATLTIASADATLDMDEMLQEAANSFVADEQYEEVTVGEIVTLETEPEMTVKSIEVVYDDNADRFYAVNDGVNAVLINVKATAEAMEDMSVHFDRMAATVEFAMDEAEVPEGTGAVESEGTESVEDGTAESEASEGTE